MGIPVNRAKTVLGRSAGRTRWWFLSIPLFFKIMGIGLVVGAVFGGVTLLQIRTSTSRALHQMLEEMTRSTAYSLVGSLERPMSTGDMFSVHQTLQRARRMFPDIRYLIVRNAEGRVVAHTFSRAVPEDLAEPAGATPAGVERFAVFGCGEGLIFDLRAPILSGHAGSLQVGVTDEMITRELASVTRSVFWTLGLCATIGAALALLLTHLLTRPIHHLVQAARQVGEGDFQTRSEVFSADEIGRLAVAFNQMTERLDRFRQQVQEKEKVRLSLIEKIVHAQEEERKSISRELHDQLGQSLLALLLAVGSLRASRAGPAPALRDIEGRIRLLIDEVRRLAWGMRPSILDDYGLDSALARHVEEVSEHFGLPVDYQYSCPPGLGRLPNQIEVTLYRIAQEALTNVVRHARATRASAVVLQRREDVTLLVEDDGCGFDAEAVSADGNQSLGLTGMQERAALLEGTCAIESVPNQGTTVRVKIPLAEASKCPSES